MSYVRTSGNVTVPPLRVASINQAAPVQNTWYTVCELRNILFHMVHIAIQTTGETLELEVTVEGVILAVAAQVAVAGTGYSPQWYLSWDGTHYGALQTVALAVDEHQMPMQALKVRVRKTTNTGAGNLRAAVSYNQY